MIPSFGLYRYIAFRNLKGHPMRASLTLIGVALGIALNVGIASITRSTHHSMRESVEAIAGKAALSVTAGETGFGEEIERQLQGIPGVYSTAPMIESRAYFRNSAGGVEQLMIFGIDLLKESAVRSYRTGGGEVIEDPLEFLNQPDSIILTQSFAAKHHLKVNDRFGVITAKGEKRFTVRGLLEPSGPAKAFGGAVAIMDIDGARVSFGKENKVDRIDLVLREGAEPAAIASAVSSRLGAGFNVLPPDGQSQQLTKMVEAFEGMLGFLSALALIVGIFLVANSVAMAVAERRREIGTLRALGASRATILSQILVENTVLGLAAGILGAVLGNRIAALMLDEVLRAMGNNAGMKINVAELQFGTPEIVQSLLLGMGVSFAAALWPALRALKIAPAEAMKPKGVDTQAVQSAIPAWYRWMPTVGFTLLVVLGLGHFYPTQATRIPALNLLQSLLGVIGGAFFAPKLVEILIRGARRIFSTPDSIITRTAFDNLLRNPSRTASNVLSLIIGLMLVVIVSAISVSFRKTVTDWSSKVISVGDMTLSTNGRITQFQVQPLHESIGELIRTLPGIELGANREPVALRFARIDYQGVTLALKAIDPPRHPSDFHSIDAIDVPAPAAGKSLFEKGAHPNILISENFARRFAKTTGDTLTLVYPGGQQTFHVSGMVRDFAHPAGVIYMNREVYKKLWRDPLVTAYFISAARGTTLDELHAQVNRILGPSHGVIATLNSELVQQLDQVVEESFSFNKAIELAALLVGLIGLLNTMLISVLERTREFGMLRAVGMSRGQLARLVITESFVQGVLGAWVAVALGLYLAWLWVTVNLSASLGWVIAFSFPASAVTTVLLAGIGVAVLASVLPALRAASLEIRSALEYE